MPEEKRSLLARAATFAHFVRQQRRALPSLSAQVTSPDPAGSLHLDGSEREWAGSGHVVRAGERFRVVASGHQWLAKPLGLVVEPRSTIYMRIGGRGVRKLVADNAVYAAWGDGEVSFVTKCLAEFADEDGTLLPGKRPRQGPGLSVRIVPTDDPPTVPGTPDGWRHLWRIGDGRIYTGSTDDIAVGTHGDVGILQRDVDVPLTEETRLDWEWLIDSLPSRLPEDLAFTHDYLSIAVEFENGRDLTYMWSAGLPEGHVFRCPLDWWCERETHWVLRSGPEGLGTWQSESRAVAADYRAALGEPLPSRVVRVWLIANSVFQRGHGKARFRSITVG